MVNQERVLFLMDSKIVRNTEYCEVSVWVVTRRLCTVRTGFTNRLYGLKPRAHDPMGPPANCVTHRVNCRYCVWSVR